MDNVQPIVLRSSQRHGVEQEDALHAWAFAIDLYRPGQASEGDLMPRSIDELMARADELAEQFEDYDPRSEDRVEEPPLMALRRAAYRRAVVERELLESVRRARHAGASWARVGEALGTSGEAARQRYGDKVDASA